MIQNRPTLNKVNVPLSVMSKCQELVTADRPTILVERDADLLFIQD